MSFVSQKTISILVGLLHMGVALGIPVYYFLTRYRRYNYTEYGNSAGKILKSEYANSAEADFDITDMRNYVLFLPFLPLVLWFIISFVMVMGIVKKHHVLMAPWVYLHYLAYVGIIGFTFSEFILAVGMGGSVEKGLPVLGLFSAILFGLILCHYPVRKLYGQMQKPVTILPTQCQK